MNFRKRRGAAGKIVMLAIVAGVVFAIIGALIYYFLGVYDANYDVEETKVRVERIFETIDKEHAARKMHPKVNQVKKRLETSDNSIDAWGTRVIFRYHKGAAEVRSAGPDKQFDTEDDIFITSREKAVSYPMPPRKKKKKS